MEIRIIYTIKILPCFYFLLIVGLILSLASCSIFKKTTSLTSDKGVVINGVKWATRNVADSGTFVTSAEDYGNYYTWEEALCACPKGWRLPTISEVASLVESGSNWTSINYKNGRMFGRGSNTLFLPASGFRDNEGSFASKGSVASLGGYGIYWTSTNAISGSYALRLNISHLTPGSTEYVGYGFTVRCVKK